MSSTDEQLADTRDMYMVHTMFRREFGLMPSLVRGVPAGDLDRVRIVAEHFELVSTILTHHHHAEDAHLWPKLLDRVPDEATSVAETMESQHAVIGKLDSELATAFGTWRGTGDPASREALATLLDELVAALTEHLATEEAQALPLIEKHITATEWTNMVQAEAVDTAPEDMPLIFGLMMYEGDPELIDEVISHLPPEVGSMLKPLGAQAFEAHAQLVYGTATPPRGF